MHQSYWDIFTAELSETPINFKQYPQMVVEIRNRLIQIIPDDNDSNTKQEITKNLMRTLEA